MMTLVIDPAGGARCLNGEDIPLKTLGRLHVTRGSHVESSPDGIWTADLSPVGGPLLGPFELQSQALNAEREWLEEHWLYPG